MLELINEYEKTAAMLEKRIQEIRLLMSSERNVFKLHKLEARKQLLEQERYEILRDIRDMEEHLTENEYEQRYGYSEAV